MKTCSEKDVVPVVAERPEEVQAHWNIPLSEEL
jgi:hypothetical protein